MKAVKSISLVLFGLSMLALGVPGAHAQKPTVTTAAPTLTVETENVPKEALPLEIVYNYERGDVAGRIGSNGILVGADRTDLGGFTGVTVGGTFVPADGRTRVVEVDGADGARGDDKRLRIRLNVTSWKDELGDRHTKITLTISW